MLKKVRLFLGSFLFISLVAFLINFVSGYFGERTNTYVKHKATLVASSIIEKAIRDEVVPFVNVEELVTYNTYEDTVTSARINTEIVNLIVANVNASIQKNIIEELDDEALKYLNIPFGIILSDTLFTNYGPMIDIKIIPIGSYKTEVVTTLEEYGINNSLLRTEIVVTIDFNTIIPLNKQEITVQTNIPIVVQTISGKVPFFYYSN